MMQDPIWTAFAQTGDPLYYLLYCAAEWAERRGEDESGTSAAR